jgi:hypothetical protein
MHNPQEELCTSARLFKRPEADRIANGRKQYWDVRLTGPEEAHAGFPKKGKRGFGNYRVPIAV